MGLDLHHQRVKLFLSYKINRGILETVFRAFPWVTKALAIYWNSYKSKCSSGDGCGEVGNAWLWNKKNTRMLMSRLLLNLSADFSPPHLRYINRNNKAEMHAPPVQIIQICDWADKDLLNKSLYFVISSIVTVTIHLSTLPHYLCHCI